LYQKVIKLKKCSLYLSNSKFATFELGFKAKIGVPAEAALTCTLEGERGTFHPTCIAVITCLRVVYSKSTNKMPVG
jgi:hypothetical protein